MSVLPLHSEDEARVIAALVALDWMESPQASSGQTISKLLGCDMGEAVIIWRHLQARRRIVLRSRFDSGIPGKSLRSK